VGENIFTRRNSKYLSLLVQIYDFINRRYWNNDAINRAQNITMGNATETAKSLGLSAAEWFFIDAMSNMDLD